ncbi:MAG TPA: glucose-6-phosphate dehydrogenase [Thermoplasmata archaeon]|nr:glucose-6-phosphate dehydrogenase [Thermoplasmata archaeon]
MATAPSAPRPIFVVIGATGDLMRRKLLPALFALSAQGHLPPESVVLGAARSSEFDNASYRGWGATALKEFTKYDPSAIDRWCGELLHYQSIGGGTPDDYRALAARVADLEHRHGLSGNRVLYLALPLDAFAATIDGLGRAGLHRGPGWTRVVIEKPFGRDLASAEALNRLVHQYFDEPSVYRIDHYLGKETVQNLLVLRFANVMFETLWSRDRVSKVEVTVAEQIGLEGRADYYDRAGALRDMVQNHLTQLLSLVGMEVPVSYSADAIRNEKVKVLQSIAPVTPDQAVLGQYVAGSADGTALPGYRQEAGINPASTTETFVALKLFVENWRWHGVPFFLRTGKRLPKRVTQIVVTFRRPPVTFFRDLTPGDVRSNQLVVTLQPDEGFDLLFEVKSPGDVVTTRTERMRFRYAEAFPGLPDDYQTLLLDVLQGDATLFVRADEVEASWRLYDRLLAAPPAVQPYAAGSWGPDAAQRLIGADEETWSQP